MLRLIVSNFGCNGNSFTSRNLLQQVPRFKINTSLEKIHMKDVPQMKNYHNVAKIKKGCSNSSPPIGKIGAIFLGCGGVSLGLVTRSFLQLSRNKVQCEGNRIAGAIQNQLQQKHETFDWIRFWFYLKPYLWKLIAVLASTLIVIYINVNITVMLGDLIKIVAEHRKDLSNTSFFNNVRKPALNLFILYITQSVFSSISINFINQIGEKMAAKLRQDLFHQVIIQDIEFFDKNRTGELLYRLTTDVQDFKMSFNIFTTQAVQGLSKFISGGISLLRISSHIPVIALASVPCVVMLMTYFLLKKLRRLNKNSQNQLERSTSVCEKAIWNVRTVRSSASEYEEIELFQHETNKLAQLAQELGYGIAVFQGLTNCLNGLVLSTFLMGEYLLSNESLSTIPPTFVFIIQGLQQSLTPSSVLIDIMIRGMSAGSRIFEYLQLDQKANFFEDRKFPKDIIKGEIRFEDVSFAYPTRPDNIVLKNISLTILPGQIVALVGASGSGKSTIAALIERFYEPSSGAIKIDGCNIKEISSHWLRGNILSYIGEQTVLFDTTIFDNIRYGSTLYKTNDVYEAAKLSQSHDFISALKDGYQTSVGEGGNQLSSDQRQRICVARALLKNPKVLILDDTTSVFDGVASNRTTLIITNNLSAIRNANLIIVLDKGCIVESGKHKELIAKRGLYYDMVQKQENLKVKNENKLSQQSTSAAIKSTQLDTLSHKVEQPQLSAETIKKQAKFDKVKENSSDIIATDGNNFQNISPLLSHKQRQTELSDTTISENLTIIKREKENLEGVKENKTSQPNTLATIKKDTIPNKEQEKLESTHWLRDNALSYIKKPLLIVGSIYKKIRQGSDMPKEEHEHTDIENNKSNQENTSDAIKTNDSSIEKISTTYWLTGNALKYVKKSLVFFGNIYKTDESNNDEKSQHWINGNVLNHIKKPVAWFGAIYENIRYGSRIPKKEQESSDTEDKTRQHNALSYIKQPVAWFGTIYKNIRYGSSTPKNEHEKSDIEENKSSQHNALSYIKQPVAWFGTIYKNIRYGSSTPKNEHEKSDIEENKSSQHNVVSYIKRPLVSIGTIFGKIRRGGAADQETQNNADNLKSSKNN